MPYNEDALRFIIYARKTPEMTAYDLRDNYIWRTSALLDDPDVKADLAFIAALKADHFGFMIGVRTNPSGAPKWIHLDGESFRVVYVSRAEVTL